MDIQQELGKLAQEQQFLNELAAAIEQTDTSDLPAYQLERRSVYRVSVRPDEWVGDSCFVSGEGGTTLEKLKEAIGKFRQAVGEWEKKGRRDREVQDWVGAKLRELRESHIGVFMLFVKHNNGKAWVAAVRVSAHYLPTRLLPIVTEGAIRTSSRRVAIDKVSDFIEVDFSIHSVEEEAGAFIDWLLSLCQEEDCDYCDGSGQCNTCHGDGCSVCEGDPECGYCRNGKVLVWRDEVPK